MKIKKVKTGNIVKKSSKTISNICKRISKNRLFIYRINEQQLEEVKNKTMEARYRSGGMF